MAWTFWRCLSLCGGCWWWWFMSLYGGHYEGGAFGGLSFLLEFGRLVVVVYWYMLERMSLCGGLCLCCSLGVCLMRLFCCSCKAWSCLVFGGFFFEKVGSSI